MKNTEYALSDRLHDAYLGQGEISLECTAQVIMQHEEENDTVLTPEEITRETRIAGEAFVDSLQSNASETYNYEKNKPETRFPRFEDHDAFQREIDRLEAMRPSVVRKAALLVILSTPQH